MKKKSVAQTCSKSIQESSRMKTPTTPSTPTPSNLKLYTTNDGLLEYTVNHGYKVAAFLTEQSSHIYGNSKRINIWLTEIQCHYANYKEMGEV